MLMIQPPPRARSAGIAARQQWNSPSRLVPIIVFQSSSVSVSTLANVPTPALLTRMSSPPNALDCGGDCLGRLVWPGDIRLDGVHGTGARDLRRGLVERPLVAPGNHDLGARLSSARAIARPIPRDPPVTSATLPEAADVLSLGLPVTIPLE